MPIWIGLKLLGGRISAFIGSNWKWLLPTVALIISFFYVSDKYYDKGVFEERARWEAKVAVEESKNRAFEALIINVVEKFGKNAVEEALKRVKTETVYRDKLQTIVKNNTVYTSCVVDQEVLDNRNAIRALGPEYPAKVVLGEVK
jgi:hypothetical protein